MTQLYRASTYLIFLQAAGLTNGSDFSRYAKNPRSYYLGSLLSLWVIGVLVSFVGLVTTAAAQQIYGSVYWNREFNLANILKQTYSISILTLTSINSTRLTDRNDEQRQRVLRITMWRVFLSFRLRACVHVPEYLRQRRSRRGRPRRSLASIHQPPPRRTHHVCCLLDCTTVATN